MENEKSLNWLAETIRHNASLSAAPFVIAIDGRSGTGKSTLAEALAERVGAVILSGDDFFSGGVEVRTDAPDELAAACIDWTSLRQVLTDLLSSGQASYLPFDWDAFDGSKRQQPVRVDLRKVVIVEGVYSARPELRDLFDMLILIDIPDDLRMVRLLQREGEIGPWECQWHRAEDWYFASRVGRPDFDVIVSSADNESALMGDAHRRSTSLSHDREPHHRETMIEQNPQALPRYFAFIAPDNRSHVHQCALNLIGRHRRQRMFLGSS
jgi:dephospho-CoA kinase